MEKLLEELWNGNVTPCEKCAVGDREAEDLIELMEQNGLALNESLELEQQKLFENYNACVEEYISLLSTHAFSDGFSLASKLMAEALLVP